MSSSAAVDGTIPGSSVQTIGGALVALAAMVALLTFLSGDFITAGAVLLYVLAGGLLFSIGRGSDLV